MGFLDSLFGGGAPVNREEMLTLCERNILSGQFEEAAIIAQKFKNRVINSGALSESQKTLDSAYAWYCLAKAEFHGIEANHSHRTYEHYKAFFAAYIMGHWCFQDLLMRDVDDWDTASDHYPYFEEINSYCDALYRDYGDDEDLERADTDANELISNAQRS